ncbi:hypothetical protein D3C72_1451140 [compost metagenome]
MRPGLQHLEQPRQLRRQEELGIAEVSRLFAIDSQAVQAVAAQFDDQYFQVAQRPAQGGQVGGGLVQHIRHRHSAQGPQQAAQAPGRYPQVMQGLVIGTGGQAFDTGAQADFETNDLSDQVVQQSGHLQVLQTSGDVGGRYSSMDHRCSARRCQGNALRKARNVPAGSAVCRPA